MNNYSNDWLNTRPYFYNTKTLRVSNQIDDCIDFDNFEWDWAGLTDYLDFGFVVFGNTPIQNVKFIQAGQSLNVDGSNLKIINNPPIKTNNTPANKEEIEHLIMTYLQNTIAPNDRILLPLSGGFDSRFLATVFKDNFNNEIKAFTFGTTPNQSKCNEVVYASKVSEILNIDHHHIQIKNIFNYAEKWDNLFGVSCHSHGNHQMMFYDTIKKKHGSFDKVLSGLGGDAWAGKYKIPEIKSPADVVKFGYTHGLSASSDYCNQKSFNYREKYFNDKRLKLEDPVYRLIEVNKNKTMLLRYLIEVPEYYGSKVISPFADETIARRMLSLPAEERNNRKWQTDHFKSKKLNVEDFVRKTKKRNQLLKVTYAEQQKPYLNSNLLKEIYCAERVNYINRHIGNGLLSKLEIYLSIPFRGRSLILPFLPKNNLIEILCEYMTLLPLQLLIEKRDEFLKNRE